MRPIYKIWMLSLLLFFSLCWNTSAQNETLHFEHIGIEEGLSRENVTAILQDSKGYIWIGTDGGGLNKYDGYTFTKYRFDPFDSNSVSQNLIYAIFEDHYGVIWVSTFEGLCKFDRATEKFTRYKPSPNARFADPNINNIGEDSDGMIWVGSVTTGLCRFDRQTGKFLPDSFDLGYRKLAGNTLPDAITCIYKDHAGVLWVGNTTGLHKIDLAAVKAGQSKISIDYRHDPGNPKSLSSDIVTSIFEDKAGLLWMATTNGLNSLDKKSGIFKRYQNDPQNNESISSNNSLSWGGGGIKEDQVGNLWIGTSKGLNKLNKDRSVFTVYYHDSNDAYSVSTDHITNLEIDKGGILWVSSQNGKLNKANLNEKGFELRRNDPNNINSLSSNEVTCIVEDSSGIFWIGTSNGGLNRWDKRTNLFTHYRSDPANPKSLQHDAVHAILEDKHGHLWICNGDILSQLNKRTGMFTHFNCIEANHDAGQGLILSITEDRDGFIWVGTAGDGIKKFNENTGKFKHYYHNKKDSAGISDYTAIAIFADSRDNIWIGYGSIATDRLNKRTGKITHYKHNPNDPASISANIVGSFYEDTKGNLWLGTWAGGLCRFDYQTGKFTTFTDKLGLADNTIYSILGDSENSLWLGTQNGLSRFDSVKKTFTNYYYKDGLQSNIFGAGERYRGAHCRGKDGTLYFGGNNGFNFFEPLQIKADSSIAPIVITQFKLFDNLIKGANESKEIVLNYDQNYFSFEFSSLSYYNPSKNQYKYKLEGVDKDWVYSGSRRYVGYTNIDPGTYTFSVKGTNNDGVWNEKGTSISIIINPPWWNTWLFKIAAALCLVVLFYGLIRWRIHEKFNRQLQQSVKEKQVAELLQQKTELEMQALRAQMNPHFIFNSLNSINRFILQNNKAQASEYLTKFSRLVRLILQNSQAHLIPLESELESLQLYLELEAVRFDHHFQFKITVGDDLDVSVLKVPPLIIQPYAENAIWHGLMHKEENGHLNIELYQQEDMLCCRITDDGIGREKAGKLKSKTASTHKSMGMQITASRIEMLQQKKQSQMTIKITDLVLHDGTGAGTEVIIKIPVLYE